jgi:hypothetical protein
MRESDASTSSCTGGYIGEDYATEFCHCTFSVSRRKRVLSCWHAFHSDWQFDSDFFPLGLGIVNIVAGFWFQRIGRQDG